MAVSNQFTFFRMRYSSVATSLRLLLSIRNIHSNSHHHPQRHQRQFIKVNHNVPYSRVHPRNVVDIYELTTNSQADFSSATTTIEASYHEIDLSAKSSKTYNIKPSSNELKESLPRISILFIHGGMWLRGDKSQSILSLTDIVSELLSSSSSSNHQNTLSTTNEKLSNIGVTTSLAGATTYVINYRLAAHHQRDNNNNATTKNNDDDESKFGGHPHQVTDVARSIAYALEREHHLSTTENRSHPPKLFIGGHSAGAHLGALALCDSRWLRLALSEQRLRSSSSSSPVAVPHDLLLWRDSLAGFFGISGVYNLSRLRMNLITSDVVFGSAFRKDVGMDDVSPLQALLRHGDVKEDGRPPILDMNVLLLNAKESDFGLEKDAEEFMVALKSLDRQRSRNTLSPKRDHFVIEGRNHLSIMRDFGSGINPILPGLKSLDEKSPDNQDESSLGLLYKGIGSIYSSALSYLTEEKVDDAAVKVLEFTSLKEP